MKDTCQKAIIRAFEYPRFRGQWAAVHELGRVIRNHSQNSIATELSDMALIGRVEGRLRGQFNGKAVRYKEWRLIR